MLIKTSRSIVCQWCRKPILLREYVGLEGSWWTEHFCCPPNLGVVPHQPSREAPMPAKKEINHEV